MLRRRSRRTDVEVTANQPAEYVGGGSERKVELLEGEQVTREGASGGPDIRVGRLYLTNRRLIYPGEGGPLPAIRKPYIAPLAEIKSVTLKAKGRELVVTTGAGADEFRVGPAIDLYVSGNLIFWASGRMRRAAREWQEAILEARDASK